MPLRTISQLPQTSLANRCCDSRTARNGGDPERINPPGLPDDTAAYRTFLARIISICRDCEMHQPFWPAVARCGTPHRPCGLAPTAKVTSELDGCCVKKPRTRGASPSSIALNRDQAANCGWLRMVRPYRGGSATVPSGSMAHRRRPRVRTTPWSSTARLWRCPGGSW